MFGNCAITFATIQATPKNTRDVKIVSSHGLCRFSKFLAINNKNTWLNRADSIFKLHSTDCLLESLHPKKTNKQDARSIQAADKQLQGTKLFQKVQ